MFEFILLAIKNRLVTYLGNYHFRIGGNLYYPVLCKINKNGIIYGTALERISYIWNDKDYEDIVIESWEITLDQYSVLCSYIKKYCE